MKLRVLIVDDEPWARRRIHTLLQQEPDVEIAGECASGEEAIAQIEALHPDILFLDVQMPGLDGFDVLEAVGPAHMPMVIFATAYDSYAVRAFDANALDYLLKPFEEERFRRALDRARRQLERGERGAKLSLEALLASLPDRKKYLRRVLVKAAGRVIFLRALDVDWFAAADNYITLHVGKEEHLLRETMSGLEEKLDPAQFLRIHRSTIVNLDRVRELQPWFGGEQLLVLKDGTQLSVGRTYRDRLQRYIENRPE